MANDQNPTRKRIFTNPLLLEAAKKSELEQLRRQRDDVSLRIEMALMSGMARLLSLHPNAGDALPPFLHLLLHDLAKLQQQTPREAEALRERLAQGMQGQNWRDSFDRTLLDSDPGQLSSLVVR